MSEDGVTNGTAEGRENGSSDDGECSSAGAVARRCVVPEVLPTESAPVPLEDGVSEFSRWSEEVQGLLFVSAVLNIGLVQSAIWTVRSVNSWLLSAPHVGGPYRAVFDFVFRAVLFACRLFILSFYGFNAAVSRIGSKRLTEGFAAVGNKIASAYLNADKRAGKNVSDLVRRYPRLQETFTEQVDDLMHYVTDPVCRVIHPGNLPKGEVFGKVAQRQNSPS